MSLIMHKAKGLCGRIVVEGDIKYIYFTILIALIATVIFIILLPDKPLEFW